MDSKDIVIHIMGGLGNQLFQIALGLSLAKRLGVNVHYDISNFFCGQGSNPTKYFSTLYQNLTSYFKSTPSHTYEYHEQMWNYYDINNDIMALAQTHDCIKLNGYWQSENHFLEMKNELRTKFNMDHPYLYIPEEVFIANPKIHTITPESVLICVRRGDYVNKSNFHFPCGMTYYKKAMNHFPENTVFYIISDDMEWCKNNFSKLDTKSEFVFLDINDDLSTFFVGSLFSNFIISNSTFHWWISYFSNSNTPKIIAPDKWINLPKHTSIYRSDMIVLERPVEP